MVANTNQIESHPLQPFLPENARLLMLGSFPPARHRWCMEFFYPNYINDMWRIFGLLFFNDKQHFVDEEARCFKLEAIVAFLRERGVAIYDTACKVRRTRNTASDKDLEVIESADLDALLSALPCCHTVVTTGQKATELFAAHFNIVPPKVGGQQPFCFRGRHLVLWRMPSSSRAYPMKIERKAEFYAKPLSCLQADNRQQTEKNVL